MFLHDLGVSSSHLLKQLSLIAVLLTLSDFEADLLRVSLTAAIVELTNPQERDLCPRNPFELISSQKSDINFWLVDEIEDQNQRWAM